MPRRYRTRLLVLSLLILATTPAAALPVFARRYRVSCQLCHNPIPALTAFGAQFAGNGFRMSPNEEPNDTVDTGDRMLRLMQSVPLAVRLDAYVQLYSNGRAVTDFQTPYGLKVLSSGALSRKISYYFYAFLAERGEVAGIEDAFLAYNDIGGAPVDVSVGQFQISDPLFKRELRLEFEDYAIYRARIGAVPIDLTYDRGIMAAADLAGFTITGVAVNGNGKGVAQSNRQFDVDAGKNFFLHATRDLPGGFRLGAFGLYGQSDANGLHNRTSMLGVDATWGRGAIEINAQYLHRNDDQPTFTPGGPKAELDGGFAELLVRPANSVWYGFGLYNLVKADQPLLDVRLGGPSAIRRYESVSFGIGRLLQRNLRVTGEGTYDIEMGAGRWTLGFVSAF